MESWRVRLTWLDCNIYSVYSIYFGVGHFNNIQGYTFI